VAWTQSPYTLLAEKGEAMKERANAVRRPLSPMASMCQSGSCVDPLSGKEPQMKRTTIGLDIAKRVFQAHAVDPESGEVSRTKLQRSEVLRYFAQLRPSLVAVEACGSAQHWTRKIRKLGHEVRLISPPFAHPFVKTNKTGAADAQAIWTAAQHPRLDRLAYLSHHSQSPDKHDIRQHVPPLPIHFSRRAYR